MKANCRRRRHSRHTVAQVTYSDLFLLAQWQSSSCHESWLAAQAAKSARLHRGADGDPDVHADPQARRSLASARPLMGDSMTPKIGAAYTRLALKRKGGSP
jgi:hypothetical protein